MIKLIALLVHHQWRDNFFDKKLPKDDIWWNIYGKDQAWNFKNANLIPADSACASLGEVSTLKSYQ